MDGCAFYLTKIGVLGIYCEDNFITKIEFLKNSDGKSANPCDLTKKAIKQIKDYLDKKRTHFDLSLKIVGTDFQKKVWQELIKIPYGQTKSYKEIAENIGNPKLARAVGMANNKNPIPIIIPCHRVIGGDGNLVGYAGGLHLKKRLLELERGN